MVGNCQIKHAELLAVVTPWGKATAESSILAFTGKEKLHVENQQLDLIKDLTS